MGYFWTLFPPLFCLPDTFLKYHPNIVAKGENSFFSSNSKYRKGISHFISTMPRARSLKYFIKLDISFKLKYSREDQLILIKSVGVWNGNNTKTILRRKDFYHIVTHFIYYFLYFSNIRIDRRLFFPRHKGL